MSSFIPCLSLSLVSLYPWSLHIPGLSISLVSLYPLFNVSLYPVSAFIPCLCLSHVSLYPVSLYPVSLSIPCLSLSFISIPSSPAFPYYLVKSHIVALLTTVIFLSQVGEQLPPSATPSWWFCRCQLHPHLKGWKGLIEIYVKGSDLYVSKWVKQIKEWVT